VDEVGGFPAALKLVKQLAKIAESEDVELKVYPKKKTTMEGLVAMLEGDERESSEQEAAARALALLRPAARALRALGGADRRESVLEMTPLAAR
jgi:hypothetical protein